MLKFQSLLARLLGAAILTLAGASHAADTETADIPEGILAKMARMNAKQGVDRDGSGSDKDGPGRRARGANDAACGSLNVGNVNTGGKRIGAPIREVTVIIRGDVINANNKCR